MKKHLSVLFLAVRSTLLPVLTVLALMAALETLAFFLVLRTGAAMPLAEVWEKSRIPLIAAAALEAVCLLHLRIGSGVTQGYTLRRLQISERTVTLWWWLSAAGSLVLLWAVQTALAFLLSLWYTAAGDAAYVNPQTIFLAFYQVPFLHGLFPLAEWLIWIRNGLFLAGLSLCLARAPQQFREGRKCVAAVAMASIVNVFFPADMGTLEAVSIVSVTVFFMFFYALYQLYAPEEEAT